MKFKTLLLSSLIAMPVMAEETDVRTLRIAGPFTTQTAPLKTDTVDVDGNAFDHDRMLSECISLKAWRKGTLTTDSILPAQPQRSLFLAGFTFENTHFAKTDIKVEGVQGAKVFVDGIEGGTSVTPGTHEVVIRLLTTADKADTLKVTMKSDQMAYITLNPEGKKMYTLADYMNGDRASSTDLSRSGRFMVFNSYFTSTDKTTTLKKEIIDLKTGTSRIVTDFLQWSTNDDRYIRRRKGTDTETIYELVDPLNGKAELLTTDYASQHGSFMRGEKEMIIYKNTEGPKKDPKVTQILTPDDRIPGYRNRNNIAIWNAETGVTQPISLGQSNVYATASDDNRKLVLSIQQGDITERPFSFTTLLLYDRDTQQVDTLVGRDGFIGKVAFSPDAKHLYIQGSPEAFGGIGKNDPTGKIPSLIQQELFVMDLATHEVRSITRDFNPNIDHWEVSRADGNIYALCENRDRKDIFRINPRTAKSEQLKLSECYVFSFSLADNKPLLSYTGQSDSNSDRVYTVDLKTGKETLIRDYNPERMGHIRLGECKDWNFVSSRGDTIYGRYYLPADFDANKKYPMLVYYYGGCSPTGRYLDSYYNYHGWAAMGYVVYVIQPSGCTGFGQEFAARHVNAYGDYTADDIITGTKRFCEEHPYVNPKKIGCLGASYGGFMTQYLCTHSDIFAAAMSHAGISNPASYWGFGYWGYSYSAVSAAHSYPWNNKELFTDHAPLFNADKCNTPLLFLHGAADTNVPINESIQMFTALKILGKETALVTIDQQDHHIVDYEKRIRWVNTLYAGFAKYLQDDPTWWNELYPEKHIK